MAINKFAAHQSLRGFSTHTIYRRRWTMLRFVTAIDPRNWSDATELDVETFIGQQRTPATRQALLCDLRAFYRWAAKRDLVNADPTSGVEPPRVPRRKPTPLSRHDLNRALATAEPRTKLILLLGAFAGLRVAEIGALHISDIDTDRGSLTVRQGKGGKDRTIPLAPIIAAHLHVYGRDGYIIGLTSTSVSRIVRLHFQSLGIAHRSHDLRHSFGTEAARQSNGNLVLVAELMGHDSVTTTQRYVGWSPASRGIVDRLYGDAA